MLDKKTNKYKQTNLYKLCHKRQIIKATFLSKIIQILWWIGSAESWVKKS